MPIELLELNLQLKNLKIVFEAAVYVAPVTQQLRGSAFWQHVTDKWLINNHEDDFSLNFNSGFGAKLP